MGNKVFYMWSRSRQGNDPIDDDDDDDAMMLMIFPICFP
jgi:hypothetical protein